MNHNAIIQTVPAAGSLHKVSGFDPMKYARRTTNAQGEPVLRLDLGYKKLWFRLACPNGRMLLNPLRITDQMSIIEAKVFFDRDDEIPASSYTAARTASESRSYIRDAQEEALNEALDNAGFGIQLCDVAGMPDGNVKPAAAPVQKQNTQASSAPQQRKTGSEEMGRTEQPASANEAQDNQAQEVQSGHPASGVATADPVPVQEMPPQTVSNARAKAEEAVTAERQPVQSQAAAGPNEPDTQSAAPKDNLSGVVDLLSQMANNGAQTAGVSAPAKSPAAEASTSDAPASPIYPSDMPVEEICKKMTLDEARAVVVPTGTCKGWTLAQVAEKRRSSLKFYMFSVGSVDNVVKAAATLLWNEMEMQKAG